MALFCGEGKEKVSKYCVLRYGIILWGGTGEVSNYCVLGYDIILREGIVEIIKILCIEIWHYTARRDMRMYHNIVY
jgi:hypothetical protein